MTYIRHFRVNCQGIGEANTGIVRLLQQLYCFPQENQEVIRNHIKSFNLSVCHYRHEHTPNRLYLSPELTIKFLFDNFKGRHPEIKVSYDSYKKEVARMNISFKLGEEECEDCIMDENHEHGNIEEGMPAKPVIAGKLMLKGQ